MKGKPIEPGCIAMIVGAVNHPKSNGKVVRVVRKLAEEEGRRYVPPGIKSLLRIRSFGAHSAASWIVVTLDGSKTLHVPVDRTTLYRSEVVDFYVSERNCAEIRLKRLDDGEEHTDETTTEHQLENTP